MSFEHVHRGPVGPPDHDVDQEENPLSVHGEYGRALEGLIAALRAWDDPSRGDWIARFEAARVGASPDLSGAARAALAALEPLSARVGPAEGAADASAPGPARPTPLQEACLNLRSHCRIILGIRD